MTKVVGVSARANGILIEGAERSTPIVNFMRGN